MGIFSLENVKVGLVHFEKFLHICGKHWKVLVPIIIASIAAFAVYHLHNDQHHHNDTHQHDHK